MAHEHILTEIRGRVGILTMNRPDKLNAMSRTMDNEMREQIRAWNSDDAIGAIVITGAGRGFCSGADISNFEATVKNGPRAENSLPVGGEWIEMIKGSKPVICAINGVAVGVGLTMTLPCDIRVAAEGARMSFPFVRIGLTPEFASTHYLVYLVGLGRAQELMLTGRFVDAEEAFEIGLVNHVYPADEMLDRAVALAQEIANNPAWQLQQTKRMIHDHYLSKDLNKVAVEESKIFHESQFTSAHREALIAFREKRRPRFHE